MARTEFSCLSPLRVRWAEVDHQGVVFNANYLNYCDVGMTDYWRTASHASPTGLVAFGHDLYMVKATVEYHTSAFFDDMLDVCMRCLRIGRSSIHFRMELWRGEEFIANAELIYVYVDPATKKPAPVPAVLREAIHKFELVAPITS